MAFNTILVRVTGTLGVAALALSLAACSGGQSVAEGCKIAQESLASAGGQIDALTAEAFAGGGSVKDLIVPLTDALDTAEEQVTNSQVAAALADLHSEFVGLGDLLESVTIPETEATDPAGSSPSPEELKAQQQLEAISGELEKRNSALEIADLNLQALCSSE